MINQRTLSIVIPAYNEESHLRECLNSIAAQTIQPYEVIVVDNNSTDNTAKIAKEFSFVTLINEKVQGISYAHHAGFKSSSSELIARIDADSALPADWVSHVLKFYDSPENKMIILTGAGYCKNLRAPKLHIPMMNMAFRNARFVLGYYAIWGPNSIFPKGAWDKIKDETCVESPSTYEDLDIALHAHKNNITIKWDKTLRVGVRIRYTRSFLKFLRYTLRWPGTLKRHKDKKWIIVQPLTALYTAFLFPVFIC